MKTHDFFKISLIICLCETPILLFAQNENETPIIQIGEFSLNSQVLGAFGTVPHRNVSKDIPNYYACFSLWVGAVDPEGVPHVSSAEGETVPEWRPLPLSWKENLEKSIPAAKTMTQGAFTDLCEIEGHTSLGLNITVTACGFDQKGFALYEFVIERTEGYKLKLSNVYVGLQADIDVPSGSDDVSGVNDRIVAMMDGCALSILDGNADPDKDPLLGVFLPNVENPILSWWTPDSDPQNDNERYVFLSGKKCTLPLPEKEADYRFLLSDGPYSLGEDEIIRFTIAILYGRGDKKFSEEVQQAEKINSQYFTSGLQKSLKKPAEKETLVTDNVTTFELDPAYPNPFNSQICISFRLPASQLVKAVLYNLLGQPVRTLLNEMRQAGAQEIVWDGKDDTGNLVVSGVYLLRLEAGGKVSRQKFVLVK